MCLSLEVIESKKNKGKEENTRKRQPKFWSLIFFFFTLADRNFQFVCTVSCVSFQVVSPRLCLVVVYCCSDSLSIAVIGSCSENKNIYIYIEPAASLILCKKILPVSVLVSFLCRFNFWKSWELFVLFLSYLFGSYIIWV